MQEKQFSQPPTVQVFYRPYNLLVAFSLSLLLNRHLSVLSPTRNPAASPLTHHGDCRRESCTIFASFLLGLNEDCPSEVGKKKQFTVRFINLLTSLPEAETQPSGAAVWTHFTINEHEASLYISSVYTRMRKTQPQALGKAKKRCPFPAFIALNTMV